MLRHLANPPNWFTAASLCCSTVALTTLLSGPPDQQAWMRACVLVVFAGVFDNLDGRVARLTRRGTPFGTELDSLADLVAFGLAPALIAWTWRLHTLGGLGIAVACAWVLASAFRLARYNVASREPTWTLGGHSEGLTTTMAGGCLVSVVWVAEAAFHGAPAITAQATAWMVGGLSLLMISSVPFRNFRDFRHNVRARRILLVAMAASLGTAWLADPSWLFGTAAAIYLVGGLFDGVVTWAWVLRSGGTLHAQPDEDASA